jgi:hypothetical protein
VTFSTPLDRFYSRNPVGSIAIDSDGNEIGPEFSFARGFGLGVAVDPCGNIVWADSERANPLGSRQLLLRTVAR